MNGSSLRVVLLTSFAPNYQVLTAWAERHGHEIVLVGTVPTTALDTTPGTVLLTHADGWTVRAGEGAVRLTH